MNIIMTVTMTNGILTLEKNHAYRVPDELGKALLQVGAACIVHIERVKA